MDDEIAEFIEEMKDAKPSKAARWVSDYLQSTKTLVSCQLLQAGFDEEYGSLPAQVLWNIKHYLGDGILQADHEGFSNQDGYQIVWQFSDDVEGSWKMAALDDGGRWIAFEMDLGDKVHRAAFLEGKIPSGANILQEQ